MKLPDMPQRGVESLGRRDLDQEIATAAAPAAAWDKVTGATFDALEHRKILKEQDDALTMYQKQQTKRKSIENAINPETGKININKLDPQVREAVTLGEQFDGETVEMITNEAGENEQWVDFHNAGDTLEQYLVEDENRARESIGSNRQMAMYQDHDREQGQKFIDSVRAGTEASMIQSTITKGIQVGTSAADAGDIEGINSTVDMLSPYLKSSQKVKLKNDLYNAARATVTNELTTLADKQSTAAFNGEKSQAALLEKQFKARLSSANGHEGFFSDKQVQALEEAHKYTVYVNTELGEMERTFFNESPDTAEKYVRNNERIKESRSALGQELHDKVQDELITRYHRLKFGDDADRAGRSAQLKMDVDAYFDLVSNGGDAISVEAEELRLRVSQNKDSVKLKQRMDIADRMKDVALMPVSERQKALAPYQQGKEVPLGDVAEMKAIQQVANSINKQIKDDPIGLFAQQSYAPNNAGIIDMNDPIASYALNEEYALQATSHYGVNVGIYRKEVANDIATRFTDNRMGMTEQLAHLQGLAALSDTTALASADQLFKNGAGVMAVATNVMVNGGDPSVMLRGKAYLAEGNYKLPEKIGTRSFDDLLVTAGVYTAFAGSFQQQAAVVDAVKAEYAGLTGGVPDTRISKERLKQAINNVTGGIIKLGDGKAIQGPYFGANKKVWDDGLERLDANVLTSMGGTHLETEQALDVIQNLSTPQHLGNGRYQFTMVSPLTGNPVILMDSSGTKPFVLNWAQIPNASQRTTRKR